MSPAALLLLSVSAAGPHDTPYDRGRFTLDVANDDFGSDVDEAFTSGVEVQFRITPREDLSLFGWLDEARRVREYWGLFLGHAMYTPALLQVTDLEVLKNDRRYAGWVHGGLSAEVAVAGSPLLPSGFAFYRFRLDVGATGPQTETATLQRYWHAYIRDVLNRRRLPEDPKGWPIYQVPNHWGVVLSARQEMEAFRWTLEDAGLRRAVGAQLGVRLATLSGVRVGNMWVDAHVGATVRAGLMPRLVFDEMSLPLLGAGERADVPVAVYGFASFRLVGSAYDALLDGPPGASGPYPERNHVMTRLEAGFALRFSAVEFMFRHVTLSPDLAAPPPGGVWIQNWGRFTLSFAFY